MSTVEKDGKPAKTPKMRADRAKEDPEYMALPVVFEDVGMAAFRIRHGIKKTDCTYSALLSADTGCEIYFKHDHRQYTGSFKERGALNALMLLDKEQKKKGVIAASAGNHALGLSYHGQRLGIPVTVVMPTIAPLTKVTKCKDFGATVHLYGQNIGEAKEYAQRLGQQQDLQYINGYDDPAIIAGAGTMGLEIIEQVPDCEAVIIPIGGAGLIAGVSMAVKMLNPDILVIGVEPVNCPSFTRALEAGKPVVADCKATLADGLAVPMVGGNAFQVARKYVDKVITVTERWIALAVLRMLEVEKTVVEGGGAAGLAPLLSESLPELKGKKVVVALCGGNIDTTVLGRVIDRGLAADGRLIQFDAAISDRPGGLAEFTRAISTAGGSVKDIHHERAFSNSDLFIINVRCVVETRDAKHAQSVLQNLADKGFVVNEETSSLHIFSRNHQAERRKQQILTLENGHIVPQSDSFAEARNSPPVVEPNPPPILKEDPSEVASVKK